MLPQRSARRGRGSRRWQFAPVRPVRGLGNHNARSAFRGAMNDFQRHQLFSQPLPSHQMNISVLPREQYRQWAPFPRAFFPLSTTSFRPFVQEFIEQFPHDRYAAERLNAPPPRVRSLLTLIVGSSHIRHMLEVTQRDNISNLGLNDREHEVILYGRGGLRYLTTKWSRSIISKLRIIHNVGPRLVILQLGSNDIPEYSEEDIVETMIDIAEFCLESGARRVVLGQLWNREDESYNQHIRHLNAIMEPRVAQHGNPDIFVWRHRGLAEPLYPFLRDGTHLTDYYTMKLYRSLRGCVLFHRRDLGYP